MRKEQVPGPAVESGSERGNRHENTDLHPASRRDRRTLELPELPAGPGSSRTRADFGWYRRASGSQSEPGAAQPASADASRLEDPAAGAVARSHGHVAAARGRDSRSARDRPERSRFPARPALPRHPEAEAGGALRRVHPEESPDGQRQLPADDAGDPGASRRRNLRDDPGGDASIRAAREPLEAAGISLRAAYAALRVPAAGWPLWRRFHHSPPSHSVGTI